MTKNILLNLPNVILKVIKFYLFKAIFTFQTKTSEVEFSCDKAKCFKIPEAYVNKYWKIFVASQTKIF